MRVDLRSTVIAGLVAGALDESDLNQVTVDTTMQKKAVKYPTDAKLLNRVGGRLANKVQSAGLTLRQSYVRVGPEAIFEDESLCACPSNEAEEVEVKKLRTILVVWCGMSNARLTILRSLAFNS